MISKKLFFGLVLGILILAGCFGFLLPWLMSAKSSIAVFIAIAIIVGGFVGVVYYFVFKKVKNESLS